MMRKDVKLGFAIGGVLLAVVVVYVLVGTGGGEKNPGTAGIVTEDPSGGTAVNAGTNSGSHDRSGNSTGSVAPAPRDASGAPANPTAANTPPSNNTPIDAPTKGNSPIASNEQPKRDANGDLWGKALDEGKLMMVSETPTPASTPKTNAPNTPNTNKPDSAAPQTGTVTPPPPSNDSKHTDATASESKPGGNDRFPLSPISSDGPSTRPSQVSMDPASGTVDRSRDSRTARADGATTHTIQRGETLALISQAAYGSPNFYPHILRANPGLVPEKLKPGMVINLPLASAVHPSASNDPNRPQSSASLASSSTAATIDARTQYRVESGDSLYRIAQKLYGKPEMADKIYDLNKDTIGADRAKLKLHAVLKLPEPPTATASTATSGAR